MYIYIYMYIHTHIHKSILKAMFAFTSEYEHVFLSHLYIIPVSRND